MQPDQRLPRFGNPVKSPAAALVGVALVVAMAALLGSRAPAAAPIQTLVLQQSKPDLHSTAIDPNHPRDGDDLTVYATLREGGKVVGHIEGFKIAVRNGTDRGAQALAGKRALLRMGVLQFSFGGNDSLMAQGLTLDSTGGMERQDPEVRAITGGTGKYAFARGQVVSTRNADGSYTHRIAIRIR